MKLLVLAVAVAVARAQFILHHDSCQNRCYQPNDYMMSCQCDYDCESIKNCCGNFLRLCRGSEVGLVVTQQELDTLAQSLWDNDVHRIDNALYSLNYQGQTNKSLETDVAINPLIQTTDGQLDAMLAASNSTYKSFIQLLDNYELNFTTPEHRPVNEIQEEDAFWALASQTQVMQLTYEFLRDNGFIKGDPHAFRTVINELWFESYKPKHGSHVQTGFETIMVSEKHQNGPHQNYTVDNHIVGFNNWVQYYLEQKAGNLDYQGYINYLQDPPVVNVRFLWNSSMARSKTFFVGTSPEFDMALFTVCGLARRNKHCTVTINGQTVTITVSVALHQNVLQLTKAQIQIPVSSSTAALNP